MKEMARKRKRYTRYKTKSHVGFIKKLSKWPAWVLWCGGIFIAALYTFVFYYLFVNPVNFRWQALYGDTKYPNGYSIQGIDISHYQGEINWRKLRGASINGNPVRFVIIKSTEGNSLLDENFNDNFFNAKDYGFIRGAYHYFVPGVPAKEQAEYFLKQVHLEGGDLPPVLDFERRGTLTPEQVAKEALTWNHCIYRSQHLPLSRRVYPHRYVAIVSIFLYTAVCPHNNALSNKGNRRIWNQKGMTF